MEYEALNIWIDVGQFVLTGVIASWFYFDGRHRVTNARIVKMKDESQKQMDAFSRRMDGLISDHSQRLARIESDLMHVPTHGDLGTIHEKINDMNASMQANGAVLGSIAKRLEGMERFMIERNR